MKLSSILNLLAKPKATSAELQEARARIDIAAAEAEIDKLEERRRSLLLSDDEAALEKAEADIKAAARTLDRQHEAARILDHRIQQAVDAERVANLERTAAEARAARERLIGRYAEIDRLATAMADGLAAIVTDHATIKRANEAVLAAGRTDLKTGDPRGELAVLLGVMNADQVPDPVSWKIGSYWPRFDALGTPLGKSHLLSRITELQPAAIAPRKAA